jgi:hypothetical protein
MRKIFRDAWILFPFLVAVKDVAATMIMLSNEPGITLKMAGHYGFMLLPGGVLPIAAPFASLCNIALAWFVGFWVSRVVSRSKPALNSALLR